MMAIRWFFIIYEMKKFIPMTSIFKVINKFYCHILVPFYNIYRDYTSTTILTKNPIRF